MGFGTALAKFIVDLFLVWPLDRDLVVAFMVKLKMIIPKNKD